ncbi:MAG: DUF1186 domain-containing protein, partial [Planctomycetaceae bacterium]|nr:DUF1186 domain-containing protein [Planctomycetaceae bacterium]
MSNDLRDDDDDIEVVVSADCQRILDDLSCDLDVIPRSAVLGARAHREQMIPHLIEVIRSTAEDVRNGNEDWNYALLERALFLLAEFQAVEAIPAITESLSLDDPFEMYGDLITELFDRIIARFGLVQPEFVEQIAQGRSIDSYVRGAAFRAWVLLARAGHGTRQEVQDHLIQLLRDHRDPPDHDVLDSLMSVLPGVLLLGAIPEEVTEVLAAGLIDPWVERPEALERHVLPNEAAFAHHNDREYGRIGFQDAYEELKDWNATLPAPKSEPEEEELWSEPTVQVTRAAAKVGRNDPCPCGSGKKYKKCCGK